ncbi:DUF1090 domain-containing protein [Pseudomonas sp. GD03944]|uniref:DUF1090 domain-containing protein n=1 Tax=Pseudomonas sp. GD03944 TaxID=2975409 RepID=UPI002446C754|nr:DUF1090 domain-containing protein [Pseudomonas sp. GD03944]MDH1263021.1 DUF1090 domain-containing protein [Pseudomonas sp. GD03944]
MRYTSPLLAALLASALAAPVALAGDMKTGCAGKQQSIERQIQEAKAQGNSHRVDGLEKALAEVKANCTDESLRQEREADVREAQAEVLERENDLKEAQAKGDAEKIATRQAKLAEAREELKSAEAQLNR